MALLLSNTISLRGSADSTGRADLYLLRMVNLERLVVDAETGPESRRSPEQVLRERAHDADAEQLAEILEALAHQPVGRHPDDIAILALQLVGEGRAEPLALAPPADQQAA